MSGREIEPLAYRVRPIAGECFESWLQRLAARHETTRKALFEYLGIESALVARDPASSAGGALDRHKAMVARLAWATALPERVIVRTFVGCSSDDLLPPALRSIGCAQCWLDWLDNGAPWRIERSWILRVSMRCERHDLLLTDLGSIVAQGRSPAARRQLESMVARTRAQMAWFAFVPTRLAWNSAIVRAQLGGRRLSYCPSQRYAAALLGNRFHFAPARHLLLAGLHSDKLERENCMERIFRFEVRDTRQAARRTSHRRPPALSDLAEAIARVGRRQLDRQRAQLEACRQDLERARQDYPAKHAARELRRQRAALARAVQDRYAAEIADASSSPLAPLRGFQNALFYLKKCGMADDAIPSATEGMDPWEECLGDVELLRQRLAKRFRHPAFRTVLGLPGYSFLPDLFERESRRSMSAMAASNSANWSSALASTPTAGA